MARAFAAAILLTGLFAAPNIAGGVTESEARSDVESVNAELATAASQYQSLAGEVDEIDTRIAAIEGEIEAMSVEYERSDKALGTRFRAIYKYSDFSALELVLGSNDINDLSERLALLSRLAYSDARLMKEAAGRKDEMARVEAQLEDEKKARLAALVDLGGQRAEIESRLRDKQNTLTAAQTAAASSATAAPAPQAPAGGTLTGHSEEGDATYYSFTGGYTAAHKTLPMGTMVRVTNLTNGEQVWVEIVDRGPWSKERIIDLEETAFSQIASLSRGVIFVRIEW